MRMIFGGHPLFFASQFSFKSKDYPIDPYEKLNYLLCRVFLFYTKVLFYMFVKYCLLVIILNFRIQIYCTLVIHFKVLQNEETCKV